VRIGVFGGEFDPPHYGHVTACRAAREQLGLARMIVVPAGTPPHRRAPETPPETRFRMAVAAFAGERDTDVRRLEVDRPGVSYTVDTLEALRPEGELFLVIGADQWEAFETWHEHERIRELATLVVAARPGSVRPGAGVLVLEMPLMGVSSSAVRRAIRQRAPIPDGIPPAVWSIIRHERLYGLGRVPSPC